MAGSTMRELICLHLPLIVSSAASASASSSPAFCRLDLWDPALPLTAWGFFLFVAEGLLRTATPSVSAVSMTTIAGEQALRAHHAAALGPAAGRRQMGGIHSMTEVGAWEETDDQAQHRSQTGIDALPRPSLSSTRTSSSRFQVRQRRELLRNPLVISKATLMPDAC